MAAVQSEAEADRAELLPNQGKEITELCEIASGRRHVSDHLEQIKSYQDANSSGRNRPHLEIPLTQQRIAAHIMAHLHTHTVNISIASTSCSVSTDTICPGVISSCDCTVGKDKGLLFDTDVKELIFIDCICDIRLFDKASYFGQVSGSSRHVGG